MGDQTNGFLSPWLCSRRITAVRPFLRGWVLDFGCGVGRLAPMVNSHEYLGFDADDWSVKEARLQYPGYRFENHLDRSTRFDTIVMLAVLEHLEQPSAILKDLARLLNPDGRIVLTTPHAAFEWIHTIGANVGLFSHHASEDHERLFTKRSLHLLAAEAALSVVLYRRFLFGANQLAVLQ